MLLLLLLLLLLLFGLDLIVCSVGHLNSLFCQLNASGQTTFYDSVCGEPLFVAPVNRTFEEWRAESVEHGWPSFRDAEVLPGALKIDKAGGIVYSKCGTHLGSFAPDEKGDRYCLDLVCLSGRPSSL